VIRPVVKSYNQRLNCIRADNLYGQKVMQDIYESIAKARIIIADVTGCNPNVFYELGMAHTFGKDVILLTQAVEESPFDIKSFRHYIYSNDGPGYDVLRKCLLKALESFLASDQPYLISFDKIERTEGIVQYFRIRIKNESKEPLAQAFGYVEFFDVVKNDVIADENIFKGTDIDGIDAHTACLEFPRFRAHSFSPIDGMVCWYDADHRDYLSIGSIPQRLDIFRHLPKSDNTPPQFQIPSKKGWRQLLVSLKPKNYSGRLRIFAGRKGEENEVASKEFKIIEGEYGRFELRLLE
jgi:hypothetical protein